MPSAQADVLLVQGEYTNFVLKGEPNQYFSSLNFLLHLFIVTKIIESKLTLFHTNISRTKNDTDLRFLPLQPFLQHRQAASVLVPIGPLLEITSLPRLHKNKVINWLVNVAVLGCVNHYEMKKNLKKKIKNIQK